MGKQLSLFNDSRSTSSETTFGGILLKGRRKARTNSQRPYKGELETQVPVGYKSGTNIDGQSYYALSCRLSVYRVPIKNTAALARN